MIKRRPRIFVSIASYRDVECQRTVKDLFDKARYPERVFAGICWQFVAAEGDDCFRSETRPGQCRVVELDARDSLGVCWARSQVDRLREDEEYIFQIDSHMRFVAEWDRVLLEMLEECPSPRSVLTTYPLPYEPPDSLAPDAVVTIQPKIFNDKSVLLFKSTKFPMDEASERPQPSAFCAAGMLFAPWQSRIEVPYDPHIYFHGEEITLAVRLWTHGWDILSPNRVVAYHNYTKGPDRARHWSDHAEWRKLNKRSVARVRHLLGMEESGDAEVLRDMERFGLGTQRTLAEYEAFSGLGFKERTISRSEATA